MEVSDYLRFYSDLGVTHLRLTEVSASPKAPVDGCESGDTSTAVEDSSTSSTAEIRDPIAAPAPIAEPGVASLSGIRLDLGDCRRCRLAETRTNLVFGSGNPDADLMLVGEAPGEDEDLQGLPFVGKAGQLLTRIIAAIGLTREQVYIANVLKCRPPNNRPPQPEEVHVCRPFLLRQIQAIRPMVVIALGKHAAQTLLETDTAISHLRGNYFHKHGTEILPTFHPSYLLRNPSAKRQVWEDMQSARDRLKQLGSVYYR